MNPSLAPHGQSASGSAPAASTSSSAIPSSDQKAVSDKKMKASKDLGEEDSDDDTPWTGPPLPPQNQVFVVYCSAIPQSSQVTMQQLRNFLRHNDWLNQAPGYACMQTTINASTGHTIEFITKNPGVARAKLRVIVDSFFDCTARVCPELDQSESLSNLFDYGQCSKRDDW
jgi:hypothetical protein